MSFHLQEGAIKQHHLQHHGTNITRDNIVNNTKIITQCSDHRKLQVLEAVYIRERAPIINIQTNMTSKIPLFDGSPPGNRGENRTPASLTLNTPGQVSQVNQPPPPVRRSERIRQAQRDLTQPP